MNGMQTPAQLFLSYAEADNEYCDLLRKQLSEPIRQKTLTLWSPYQVEPGKNAEDEIFSHLDQASLILLLFSPDYLDSKACYKQLQRAIQIGEQDPERVWIVLLRPCAWMEIQESIIHKKHFPFLPHSYQTISHRSLQDRDDVAQDIVGEIITFVERMQRVAGGAGGATKGPTTPLTPPEKLLNPYLALRSFGIEDEPSFCGREGPTREILDKIESMLGTRNTNKEQRLLAIIGASGAGKSSLVHAGVLPRLIRGELAGSEAWIILRTLYPGDRPLDNLTDILCDHLPSQERHDVKGTLTGSTSGLGYIVHDILRHSQPRKTGSVSSDANVVLVIDQFEECLTQSSQAECKTFIELLFAAATRRQDSLLILMICRADFYQELMGYSAFFELLRQHEVILNKPMTLSEMRAAIEAPLHRLDRAFQFEPKLVDQIIADLQGQKEALPLLQFTLFEMFERRQGFWLTQQAYQEIHGINGALEKHAEKIYDAFQGQQTAVRKLFLSLVKVSMGEDQEFVVARQRIHYEQILPLDRPANSVELAQMNKMINDFVDARLLTANKQNEQRTLEISHEILLQAWPRLAGWVRESEEALYKKNSATQDARNWQKHSQPQKDLYTGQQLRQLKNLARQKLIAGDEPLRTFFQRSQARQNWKHVVQVGIILACLLVLTPLAYAISNYLLTPKNQILVTNSKNDGPGSLPEALKMARPGDTIVLDASNIGQTTITLQRDLNFAENDDNVTLRDDGITLTAPTGQQIHIFPGINVTFDKLSIKNSGLDLKRAQGGVIFNQGLLSLIDCHISNNQSNYNGGALDNTGDLVLDNTTFSQNRSTGYGGAIFNAGGSVRISNRSAITGNHARDGGGLYSIKGAVTIIGSSIEDNVAGQPDGSRYFGGGLAFRNATLNMTDSAVERNQVDGDGGGISLLDASATLKTSIITKNTAIITNPSDRPAWGGGGIAVETSVPKSSSSQALLVNMPVTDNTAKTSAYIGGNFIQPGASSSPVSDILGQQQAEPGSLSIAANPSAVAIGYPPSNGKPEYLSNYAGTINVDLFCQIQGYSQGDPTPDDLSLITCVSPLESTLEMPQTQKYLAVKACKDQYNIDIGQATTRLYDYYDLSTWECYQKTGLIFSFTEQNMAGQLEHFCQATYGKGAGLYSKKLPRTTAYDWQCEDTNGKPVGISMADTCRSVTNNQSAFERLARFDDSYGWECWAPLS